MFSSTTNLAMVSKGKFVFSNTELKLSLLLDLTCNETMPPLDDGDNMVLYFILIRKNKYLNLDCRTTDADGCICTSATIKSFFSSKQCNLQCSFYSSTASQCFSAKLCDFFKHWLKFFTSNFFKRQCYEWYNTQCVCSRSSNKSNQEFKGLFYQKLRNKLTKLLVEKRHTQWIPKVWNYGFRCSKLLSDSQSFNE